MKINICVFYKYTKVYFFLTEITNQWKYEKLRGQSYTFLLNVQETVVVTSGGKICQTLLHEVEENVLSRMIK